MTDKNKLENIQKFIDSIEIEEVGEGRFQEIVSTQKIVDTRTGKEYNGMVDTEVLRLMNDINERNQRRKKEIIELKEVNGLLLDMIDGFHAYFVLKKEGYFE